MGADIYLRSVNNAARAKWEPIFKAAVAKRDSFPRGSAEADAAQEAAEEAYEGLFGEGYFRDSYNATSLFGFLGISWWNAAGFGGQARDHAWSINGKAEMSVRSMTALRRYLADHGEITPEEATAWRRERERSAFPPCFEEPENGLDRWREMFERKRHDLIALLDQAIALKEPLYCSV